MTPRQLKKEAVALGINEELQKERESTAALRQELVERREELEGAAEEASGAPRYRGSIGDLGKKSSEGGVGRRVMGLAAAAATEIEEAMGAVRDYSVWALWKRGRRRNGCPAPAIRLPVLLPRGGISITLLVVYAPQITRLNELAEHKSMQLLSVVRQLQDERQAAEEHRSEALERERRAEVPYFEAGGGGSACSVCLSCLSLSLFSASVCLPPPLPSLSLSHTHTHTLER